MTAQRPFHRDIIYYFPPSPAKDLLAIPDYESEVVVETSYEEDPDVSEETSNELYLDDYHTNDIEEHVKILVLDSDSDKENKTIKNEKKCDKGKKSEKILEKKKKEKPCQKSKQSEVINEVKIDKECKCMDSNNNDDKLDTAITITHVSKCSKKPKTKRKPKTVNVNESMAPNTRKVLPMKKPDNNMKMTDFFPVRRSNRKTAKEVKKEKLIDLEDLILAHCEDGLKIHDFEGKGRGIVATKKFLRSDFVVEYKGDLIDLSMAKDREKNYSRCSSIGCYMYYFTHRGTTYCLDATKETPYFGRLLNHSCKKSNCQTKVVNIEEKPYLILVASRDIEIGEELLYDYGDRNKESLLAHPWLAS